MLDCPEHALEVHRHHGIEHLVGILLDGSEHAADAGIQKQAIDRAVGSGRVIERCMKRGLVGNVRCSEGGAPAKVTRGLFEQIGAAGDQRNTRAGLSADGSGGASDACGGAGDDDVLARKVDHSDVLAMNSAQTRASLLS